VSDADLMRMICLVNHSDAIEAPAGETQTGEKQSVEGRAQAAVVSWRGRRDGGRLQFQP